MKTETKYFGTFEVEVVPKTHKVNDQLAIEDNLINKGIYIGYPSNSWKGHTSEKDNESLSI